MPDTVPASPPGVAPLVTPDLAGMFAGFFSIGVMGFGGVLPWARRMMVDQRRWLTAAEFNDLLALCQFLPGPNIVNMSVALGSRYRGVPGSLACLGGLLMAPFIIVCALGGIFARYGNDPVVAHGFAGLAAAASGLVVAMAVKIAAPLRGRWLASAIALVTFAAMAILRLPLLPTMLVAAPISVLLLRRAAR